MSKPRIDLSAIRARLAGTHGRQFWRSLDELAETAEFQEMVGREFPRQAAELRDPLSRRTFLKLMSASLAMAGLTGCALRQPDEKLVPYVRRPEELVATNVLHYATAIPLQGYALGVLAESHNGRPTKLEGNPGHTASLGATDAITQASILTLYDPDRSQGIANAGTQKTWNEFTAALGAALQGQAGNGAGLRVLTGTVTSPTLAQQLADLLAAFPQARWYQYEPVGRDNERAGALLAFGEPVDTIYDFARASVVVALDGDFLNTKYDGVRYSQDWAEKRRVRTGKTEISRLYVAEPTPSLAGGMADHRLPVKAGRVEALARALAAAVGVAGAAPAALNEAEQRWVEVAARDLQGAGGDALVFVGESQPPIVHALGHAINAQIGAVGATVRYVAPVAARGSAPELSGAEQLRMLVGEMGAGQVQVLLIIDSNPVYTAPADVDFAGALANVPLSVHLGLYQDETGQRTTWHVNQTHFLEEWSDALAFDGTATIIQPLIAPLWGGKSAHELLSAALGQPLRTGFDIVRSSWNTRLGDAANVEAAWVTALNAGFVADTAAAAATPALQSGLGTRPGTPAAGEGLELVFRPDPSIWDGRWANNGWLQELPKPFSKVVWDNMAIIAPATAQRLGVQSSDVLRLTVDGRTAELPAWIQPGQAEDVITVQLGFGRSSAGRVGGMGMNQLRAAERAPVVGVNVYPLRTSAAPWFAGGLEATRTGGRYELISTQGHFNIAEPEKRHLVRAAPIEEFIAEPEMFVSEKEREKLAGKDTIYPKVDYSKLNQWGMVIDQNVCIGCNTCMVACQAENNIPVVGKVEVSRGRDMHWLRIDTYYAADLENPSYFHQPMLCQHCETAPCEAVCPVAATVHDAEGLNNMVYNRCVGTKYCSNNCPFKVRRFNFLQYNDIESPTIALQRNPDVTVRLRGVMEKCSFCVQRIAEVRQSYKARNIPPTADTNRLPIQDGEVQTACAQACPTRAIIFGDINDPSALVTRTRAEPHNYTLLAELNVFPRTSYLARLSNPNPALGTGTTEEPHGN